MADTKDTEEEPLTPSEMDEASDKKKKIKKILIIAAPILIAVIGSLYFFFFVLNAANHDDTAESHEPIETEHVQLDANTYLDIDPITIGLSPSGPKREHLRMDLTLRLSTIEESNAVLTKMPIIKDTLITFLRSLRSTDFNSSSSTIYLKEEISKRINKITAPVVIKEVLFQEITVN